MAEQGPAMISENLGFDASRPSSVADDHELGLCVHPSWNDTRLGTRVGGVPRHVGIPFLGMIAPRPIHIFGIRGCAERRDRKQRERYDNAASYCWPSCGFAR